MLTTQMHILEDLSKLGIEIVLPTQELLLLPVQLTSDLVDQIRSTQDSDDVLRKLRLQVEAGKRSDFMIHSDGTLRHELTRLCVPRGDLR